MGWDVLQGGPEQPGDQALLPLLGDRPGLPGPSDQGPEGRPGHESGKWGGEEPHLALPPVLLEEVEASPRPGLVQPQQSPGGRQPGPHRREWQAQAFAQARPRPQPWPQGLLLDLPFHDLCNDAVQDVGDAVVLWGGGRGGQESSGSPGPPGRAHPASIARPPAHHPPPLPLPPHPCSHWAGQE